MYDYAGLYALMRSRGLKPSELITPLHISSRTLAKIARGEKVAPSVIQKFCTFFECSSADLYRVVSRNHLLQQLRDEKNHHISGGIYHELQIRMTYNSNHMEGSQLSEEQTRHIFETRTIDAQDGLPIDDIIEASNHFHAINYCIDNAEEPLNEDMIFTLHTLLKNGTHDANLPWFHVGAYKTRRNVIGMTATSEPNDVPAHMHALLADYTTLKSPTFEDIVDFHYHFESIHPFQDGNGRVGRLIAFKECLRAGIVPFFIEDTKKHFYYRGLREYPTQPGFLRETCADGQDTVRALMAYFEVPEN